jgi:hypothetical protein
MKVLRTLIVLLVIGTATVKAQYFPTGMTWEEIVVDPYMEQENVNACIYEIGTDTIIGDVTYKKVLKDNVFSGLCVRESGDKVWLLTKEYPTEILLYNFDWDSNQEIVTEYLKGQPHMVQDEEEYEVRQETTSIGDSKTVEIEGQTYQYIMKRLSGTLIRGIGKVAELNRYPCLLSYREPYMILPGLEYHKVHWIKRNGVEIFRSESAKEWTDEVPASDTSQEKMLKEGKTWNYEISYRYMDNQGQFHSETMDYKEWICGDTVIADKTYYKMCHSTLPKIPMNIAEGWREEDGRVYVYRKKTETEELLYDFNLKYGDEISLCGYNGLKVTTAGSVTVRGIERRVIALSFAPDGPQCQPWVEGVGAQGLLIEPLGHEVNDGLIVKMLSCYEGDECIFTAEDYDIVTSVKDVSGPVHRNVFNPDEPVYNLSGQKVNASYKGVVIQNGKKYLQK